MSNFPSEMETDRVEDDPNAAGKAVYSNTAPLAEINSSNPPTWDRLSISQAENQDRSIQKSTAKSPWQWPLLGATTIAVAGMLLFAFNRPTKHPLVEKSAISAIPVSTQVVTAQPIEGTNNLTGTVEAVEVVTVTSRVVGQITSLPFKEGDRVRSGQVLAKIDVKEIDAQRDRATAAIMQAQSGVTVAQAARTQAIAGASQVAAQLSQSEAQLQQAQAQLQQAQAQKQQANAQYRNAVAQKQSVQVELANARLTQKRRVMLQTSGAIGQSSLDEANTQVAVFQSRLQQAMGDIDRTSQGAIQAQAGIAQAQAGIAQAQAGIRRSRAALNQAQAQVGQASSEVARSRTQVQEATASKAQVTANLNYGTVTAPFDGVVIRKHTEVGAMAGTGQAMIALENTSKQRFSVDAPEALIPQIKQGQSVAIHIDSLNQVTIGTVDRLIPAANPNSHNINIKIALPANPQLISGMFGRLELPGAIRQGIIIPSTATIERGQLQGVYVVDNQRATLRWVKTGKTQKGNVEVTAGLSTGDRVIISNLDRLKDGQAVIVR